jgi:hypothetical protein
MFSDTYTTTSRGFYAATGRALFLPFVLGPRAALPQMLLRGFISPDIVGGKRGKKETGLDIGGAPFPGQDIAEVFSPITNLGGGSSMTR